MKLKRVLAGIIACTLVATAMGATAFAADAELTDIVTTTEVTVLRGDINNNGKVTIEDALILSRYLVSGDSAAKAAFAELMELNLDAVREENGQIGILAIIDILKEVVKRTPVETTTPETSETTVSEEETTVSEEETTVSEEETTVSEEETTVSEEETTVETEDPELVESALADLAAAIEIAEVERLNEEYTEDSWLALEDALAAAKEIGEDATIAEIVAATEALTAAINALVTAEDLLAQKLEALTSLVATAEEKVAADDEENPYDADSLSNLNTAIDEANYAIIYYSDSLEELTAAYDALEVALAELKTEAQVVKEAGVALKADIVIAKKYASTSTEDLNTAIAEAEALYSRTGNILAGTTMEDIVGATDGIKSALKVEIDGIWGATPTAKDNAADTYEALAYAAIDAGYFGYEDIFTAAGLTLDESQAAILEEILAGEDADAVASEVEGFYAEILAEEDGESVSIADFDTIKELDAVFQAFKTKTNAAAATAKADAKAAYDKALDLSSKTTTYSVGSLEALELVLSNNEAEYISVNGDIAAGTTLFSKVDSFALYTVANGATASLVTLVEEKAAQDALILLDKLLDNTYGSVIGEAFVVGIYNDMLVLGESGAFSFVEDYNRISLSNRIAFLTSINKEYAVIADQLKNVIVEEDFTGSFTNAGVNASGINVTALNTAVKNLSTTLLNAKKAQVTVLANEIDTTEFDADVKTDVVDKMITAAGKATEANVNTFIANLEAIADGNALVGEDSSDEVVKIEFKMGSTSTSYKVYNSTSTEVNGGLGAITADKLATIKFARITLASGAIFEIAVDLNYTEETEEDPAFTTLTYGDKYAVEGDDTLAGVLGTVEDVFGTINLTITTA